MCACVCACVFMCTYECMGYVCMAVWLHELHVHRFVICVCVYGGVRLRVRIHLITNAKPPESLTFARTLASTSTSPILNHIVDTHFAKYLSRLV